jgi:flagellar biosynthesis protein
VKPADPPFAAEPPSADADADRGAADGPALLAVALRYLAGTDAAPTVVATGRGAVARRILAVAEASGVPLVADPDLAALLAHLDLDRQIPEEAFAAVAEILICLYRANAELAGAVPAAGR